MTYHIWSMAHFLFPAGKLWHWWPRQNSEQNDIQQMEYCKKNWLTFTAIYLFIFFASIKSSRQYFFLAVLERLQLHSVCSARVCLQQCFVICFRMCRPIASVFWKLMSMAQQDEIGKDGPTATTQWNTLNNELWNSNLGALLRLRIL